MPDGHEKGHHHESQWDSLQKLLKAKTSPANGCWPGKLIGFHKFHRLEAWTQVNEEKLESLNMRRGRVFTDYFPLTQVCVGKDVRIIHIRHNPAVS